MNVVYLKDGTTSGNMNLLPSAYFTLEKGDNYFLVQGGGHGHGAGMSQYGAKYLAKQGLSYEEIAQHCGKPAKSVDAALQRIRKKLSAAFAEQ